MNCLKGKVSFASGIVSVLLLANCAGTPARLSSGRARSASAASEKSSSLQWVDYFDVLSEVNKNNRLYLMLYFSHDPCEPCEMLEKYTLSDPRVVAALKSFVPVMFKGDMGEQMAERFHVQTYPMLIFARTDNGEIDRKAGYRDADYLLEWIQNLKAGKNTMAQVQSKLESQPDNVDLLLRQARNYLDADELGQALKLSKKADEVSPGNAGSLIIESLCHLRNDELEDAEKAVMAALTADAQNDEARRLHTMILLKKAESLLKSGKYTEATDTYSQILKADPDNFTAHLGLGHTHREAGRSDLARKEFEKAIAIRPDSAVPHVALGDLFQKDNDDASAEQEYLKALVKDPKYEPPYFRLMELYERNGRPEDLIKTFGKVLPIEPAGAQNEIAWLLATSKFPEILDPVTAEKFANAAVELDPSPMYIDTLAEAYYAQGRYKLAISIIKEAIALNPDDPKYYQGQLDKFAKALSESLGEQSQQD